MKLIQIGTIILLGSTAFAAACSGDGDGGTGGTGGTSTGSGSGTGSGAGTSTGAGSGTGGSGSGSGIGTGGGGNTTCTALAAGALTDSVMFFGGTSAQATGEDAVWESGTGHLSDTDGVPDPDSMPTTYANNPWASISYALGADGACANIAGLQNITVTVTSVQAAKMRIGISTPATTPVSEGGTCTAECSNHWVLTETFTAGEEKTLVLPANGVGLGPSWSTGGAAFTPNSVLQIVVGIQPTDDATDASIPAFDVTLSDIVAN